MMQVKEISKIIFLLILALPLVTAGSAAANVISVNNSTGQVANFTSIQAAVAAANPGDKIVVEPGVYKENIAISKNIYIVSKSGNFSDTVVRAADDSQDIFSIWANGVSIKGFGITGSHSAGIHLFGIADCHLENNRLFNNSCGIDLYIMSSGNTLDNNEISGCLTGISLGGSMYNNLSNNLISNCSNGISLFDSPNNILQNNTISENAEGIYLTGESNGNTLIDNTVTLNEKLGLYLYETSNNQIYNNYFNNMINVKLEMPSDTNVWNTTKTEGINIAGGPYLGGNLWARPDGIAYSDSVQDANLDGILDSQYNIEGSTLIDYLPLYLPLKESKPVILTVSNTGQAADFTSIQDAVDHAFPGDTILISPGVYEENVNIHVTNLTLTSESDSRGETIVKAASSMDDVFNVIADEVTIRGLNIIGPVDYPNAGIRLNGVKYCNIESNQLFSNYSDSTQGISSENGTSPHNSGSEAGFGIRFDSSSSNSLNNNAVSGNGISIFLHNSKENILLNNSASGSNYGIWVDSSSNNTLDGNNLSDNKIGAYLKISSGNVLTGNTALNNTGSGISVWDSAKNTLINNAASNNYVSIYLQNSSENGFFNNAVSGSNYGMWIAFSSNNNLSNNNASNNKFGFYLKNSSDNRLSGNQANSNFRHGIYLGSSRNNILDSNRISSNSEYGLYLLDSGNSSIYNNYFNNINNIYLQGSNAGTSLNTTLTPEKSILNGPYLGGNFLATPTGDGFSQIHADKNGDSICDEIYVVNSEGIDYLPLADSRTTI